MFLSAHHTSFYYSFYFYRSNLEIIQTPLWINNLRFIINNNYLSGKNTDRLERNLSSPFNFGALLETTPLS